MDESISTLWLLPDVKVPRGTVQGHDEVEMTVSRLLPSATGTFIFSYVFFTGFIQTTGVMWLGLSGSRSSS